VLNCLRDEERHDEPSREAEVAVSQDRCSSTHDGALLRIREMSANEPLVTKISGGGSVRKGWGHVRCTGSALVTSLLDCW
jgi:hypothetical protein